MINENLRENIRSFVFRFGRVGMAQIEYMFRDYNKEAIRWHVNSLIYSNVFNKDEMGRICAHTPTGITDSLQSRITYAAWVVAFFGSQEILNFYVAEYPTQVIFLTSDNRAFDITVLTPTTAKITAQISGRLFKMFIPPKSTDSIHHIALLTHKEMIDEVAEYNVFDHYAVLKKENSKVVGIDVGNYDKQL